MTEEYYIGQTFESDYDPEAAVWCNEQGNCHIEEIETLEDGTRQFQIVENTSLTEEEKEEQFNTDFFLTSLGYIRRKVTMLTGEIKDFLSDLLPVISLGFQTGQEVTIITYNEPDFTQDLTTEYMETLQETKTVTSDFIQECYVQLSNDFLQTGESDEEESSEDTEE